MSGVVGVTSAVILEVAVDTSGTVHARATVTLVHTYRTTAQSTAHHHHLAPTQSTSLCAVSPTLYVGIATNVRHAVLSPFNGSTAGCACRCHVYRQVVHTHVQYRSQGSSHATWLGR